MSPEREVTTMLNITTTGRGAVTMTVRGELTLVDAPALRDAITGVLNQGEVTTIDLDLGGLRFIDSAGAGTIVVAHRIAAGLGVRLRVTSVPPFAAALLDLLEIDAAAGERPAG
jgi:anti-sigma B factor antagonist